MKNLLKLFLVSLYPLAFFLYKIRPQSQPFLCIITPIFDPALKSVRGLIDDLRKQSFPNFTHILISNGAPPKIKKYIQELRKRDKRFISVQLPEEKQNSPEKLQANLAKRKNYAMKNYKAERYVFIDADSEIIDLNFIAKLYMAHILTRRDIIVAKIKLGLINLPIFPINIGRIDMTNYTFSRKIAINYPYPASNKNSLFGTDFRYFLQINNKTNTIFFDFVYLIKDSRKSYESVHSILTL